MYVRMHVRTYISEFNIHNKGLPGRGYPFEAEPRLKCILLYIIRTCMCTYACVGMYVHTYISEVNIHNKRLTGQGYPIEACTKRGNWNKLGLSGFHPMYVYVCACVWMYVHKLMHKCTYIRICVCKHTHVCMYRCTYVHIIHKCKHTVCVCL